MTNEMIRTITMVPYDPNWADLFQQEAAHLSDVFKSELLSIHHIGSTAIPGIYAKPIIDILPVVKEIAKIDLYHEAMTSLGYEARGEYGIPGRRYFSKDGVTHRTHQIHVYELGHPEIDRYLRFRDYLIQNPAEALSYSKLKQKLSQLFPHDIVNYVNGKTSFVRAIDEKAKKASTKR